ncbi:hypothetical protein JXI42_06210 [bacterium]|nr:hypothetical protein [bacterium]
MENRLRTWWLILLVVFGAVAFAFAQEEDTLETPSLLIPKPALFRGTMSSHLPLIVVPLDSAGGRFTWFPIPEIGVVLTPSFKTRNYQFEFPVTVKALFPFLDYYGTLSDLSVESIWRVSNDLSFGGEYRLIRGRFQPLDGKFITHVASLDIGIPIQDFYLSGLKFEWAVSTSIEFSSGFREQDKINKEYKGSVIIITPYWRFRTRYGNIYISFRSVLSSKINRVILASDEVEPTKSESIYSLEISFIYP